MIERKINFVNYKQEIIAQHPVIPGEIYGEKEKTDQQAAKECPHSANHLYSHRHNDHLIHDPGHDS